MSIIKLAVYGALGYLIYQTFFAETSGSQGSSGGGQRGGGMGNALRGAAREVAGAMGGGGGSQGDSIGGTRMTGGGAGRVEQTGEPSGAAVSHRVGRGVR